MRNVIDVYAGVGGLSLGASRAGFHVKAAIEFDEHASRSHQNNFPNTVHSEADVSTLSGVDILDLVNLNVGELDGLIGGPPCQGFSTMGRRDIGDERNTLFGHFFELVREMQPKFFLAENVPGIMHSRYDALREHALGTVANDYTILAPFPVSAHHYGAPTTRTRFFFIGYKPEHFESLTPECFAPDPEIRKVTVREALSGLPQRISPNWQNEEDGWKRLGDYQSTPFMDKARGEIPDGVGCAESIERYVECREISGCLGTKHREDVIARFAQVEMGKSDRISKATRLDLDGFCPTLRAGTARDKGSYQAVRPLHPTENRVITPREAARLQGFPDWFVFHETKWHSFRQIGNSVSPIAAESLLRTLKSKSKKSDN